MTMQNRLELMEVLEKIAAQPLFREYQELHEEILSNSIFFFQISTYRLNQEQYTQSHGVNKEQALKNLKRSKAVIDTSPSIKKYFQTARQIEMFLDDLNYSLNKEITTAKQGCHT